MSRRKPVTRVIARKTKYVVIRYGHVQFAHKDLDCVETFLSTFDPELYERRKSAPRINALIEQLIAEANAEAAQ